ncbi:uncharacterized protein LOC122306383 [Carya illinoinensis]|uniref:uncharacterized protein LOC122306383 n=1 Tax=Carya illinoinensis TaxID=32201 RepID=UPI001C718933|nr:uncharacterized protein LOC122306383 [Carya illinoinensis]
MVGRSKYNTFRGIKDRVWLKISNWKNQFRMPVGKEILLKAVIQAILTYHMSVFLLPKRLCMELAGLMSKFWWGHKENDKKIKWMSWGKMGVSKFNGGLGFRELESFNKALLAKQVWRILINPSSIVARVLKDKYFKRTSVLNAKLGIYPSMIWRSLRSSIELLKGGLVWRVGDVQSPARILEPDARVDQLLEDGKWKSELVKEIFKEEEAEIILIIPINQSNMVDKQIWTPSKKERDQKVGNLHTVVVRSRGGRNCPAAVDVWAEVNSPVQKWPMGEVDLGQLWNRVVDKCSEEEVVLIATVMRNIWLRRNSFVFEEFFSSLDVILNKAKASIEAYQEAQSKPVKAIEQIQVHREKVRWKAPREGLVKINWDAAYDLKSKRMGIEVVIRDAKGEVLVSLCKTSFHSVSVAAAEVVALWRALILSTELNIGKAIFEGKAFSIIQAVCSSEERLEWHGQRLGDIRELLRRRPLWRVIHTYREGNLVADFLAKFALNIDDEKVWIEDGPSGYESLILGDKSCNLKPL